MASTDSEDQVIARNRRTLLLLLGAAASLLLPLLGVLYIRLSETPAAAPGRVPHAFARRENQADRIKAAPTPAPQAPMVLSGGPAGDAEKHAAPAAPAATGNDSLGFIKGGSEYFPSRPADAPARTKTPPPAAQTAGEDDTAAGRKKPAKRGPKPFLQPKLQAAGSGGALSHFRGGKQPAPGQATPGAAPDVGSLLQDIPGADKTGQTGGVDVGSLLKAIPGQGGDQKK